jgi:hypothetical protein
VVAVRGRNIDNVDIGVSDELVVRAIELGCAGTLDVLDEGGSPVA